MTICVFISALKQQNKQKKTVLIVTLNSATDTTMQQFLIPILNLKFYQLFRE